MSSAGRPAPLARLPGAWRRRPRPLYLPAPPPPLQAEEAPHGNPPKRSSEPSDDRACPCGRPGRGEGRAFLD
jgi:hypothetical protein